MRLSPKDIEKLMLHNAGFLAQKRYARGLKLNYPEAIALIAAQLLELIREGDSVASLMNKGKQLLGIDDVMEGVAKMVDEVQVEGTFPDGTKLVTVHHPICNTALNNGLALYGSGLTRVAVAKEVDNIVGPSPGATLCSEEYIELNAGRKILELEVVNTGDRPIQVGSHYLFAETNRALAFDRVASIGYRLDIPAGTAVRFEPGELKKIQLVEIAGERIVYGGNNLCNGPLTEAEHPAIVERMKTMGFIK